MCSSQPLTRPTQTPTSASIYSRALTLAHAWVAWCANISRTDLIHSIHKSHSPSSVRDLPFVVTTSEAQGFVLEGEDEKKRIHSKVMDGQQLRFGASNSDIRITSFGIFFSRSSLRIYDRATSPKTLRNSGGNLLGKGNVAEKGGPDKRRGLARADSRTSGHPERHGGPNVERR